MTTPLVIIPSRMESERFPGKAMHEIAGLPMLEHIVMSVEAAGFNYRILMPDTEANKIVADKFAGKVKLYDMDPLDVAGRIKNFLRTVMLESFIRVCHDSPLLHPSRLHAISELHMSYANPYFFNYFDPSGQHVEIFYTKTFLDTEFEGDALEDIGRPFGWREPTSKVSPMTVDTPEDADLIEDFIWSLDKHPIEMSYADLMRIWTAHSKYGTAPL